MRITLPALTPSEAASLHADLELSTTILEPLASMETTDPAYDTELLKACISYFSRDHVEVRGRDEPHIIGGKSFIRAALEQIAPLTSMPNIDTFIDANAL